MMDEYVTKQRQVVVLAEHAVERFDPTLIGDQLMIAAAREQAEMEPVILPPVA